MVSPRFKHTVGMDAGEFKHKLNFSSCKTGSFSLALIQLPAIRGPIRRTYATGEVYTLTVSAEYSMVLNSGH